MMEKREGFFCFRKGVSHIHPPKYALFDLSVEAPSPRATLFFAAYWLGALWSLRVFFFERVSQIHHLRNVHTMFVVFSYQKIQNTLFFHQGYGAMKSCAPRNCYYQSAESIIEVTRDEIKRCLSEQWVVTDRCINASGVFLERLVCVHNMVGLAYLIIQEGELIFVPYRMYLLACVCGAFACAG